MKKTIILLFFLVFIIPLLISCGEKDAMNNEKEKISDITSEGSGSEKTVKEKKKVLITKPSKENKEFVDDGISTFPQKRYNAADYTKIAEFKAPEGDRRQIAKEYMLKMAGLEWTPAKTFTVTWKNSPEFSVKIPYEAGKIYRGPVYSRAHGNYEEFAEYLVGKEYTYGGPYYYEETVGNHCSSSMLMAYQQLINMPKTILKPLDENRRQIILAGMLKEPKQSEWYAETVLNTNGREAIYKAYSTLKTGDILNKNVKSAGHTRMVDYVDLKKDASGKINYSQSMVYTIEQTNTLESKVDPQFVAKNGYDTTWWIDHSYSFKDLFDTGYMPCTLPIFESEEPIQDAYICYTGKNTKDTVTKTLTGSVISNFPLTYILMRVTDKSGKTVSEVLINKLTPAYSAEYRVNLGQYHSSLIDGVPAGNYTFTLRAGIARGSAELDSFEFTK